MYARDAMQTSVHCLRSEDGLLGAVRMLVQKGFSGAPVVDAQMRVIGILSERDCLVSMSGAVFYASRPDTVGERMSRDVTVVHADDDIFRVTSEFVSHPYRRLPVVDEQGRLIGLITRRDLMRYLGRVLDHHNDGPRRLSFWESLRGRI
jgi:CBS domain-containing protein